ncbi:MAG: hypothetical protein AAB949_01555 [Patescibacteria group bacterium]
MIKAIFKLKILPVAVLFLLAMFSPSFSHADIVLNDGILVKGIGSSKVYFLENGIKRWVPDAKTFNRFEFEWQKIFIVPDQDLDNYPIGKNIAPTSNYPDGSLLRASAGKGGDGVKVYAVKSGKRYWIKTAQDFENLGLPWQIIMDISAKKLKSVPEGTPITQPAKIAPPLIILSAFPDRVIEGMEAEFQFNGVPGRQDKKTLKFETFLEGVDAKWVSTSAKSRKIKLPQTSGRYKFFVRAKDPDGNTDRIPKSYEFWVNISPLYKKLTLSSVSAMSKESKGERFMIANPSNEPIKLSGWTIGSKKFNTRYGFPEAYDVPQHVYYPDKKEIILPPKGKLTVYAGKSPMGYSFRINQCVGYLNQNFKFSPALPNYCAKADPNEAKKFSAYCQKIISQTSGCKEPNLNDALIDSECRQYLSERFNYSQCVIRNSNFFDFFRDEWMVYLDQPKEIFANDHDDVLLRDPDGLVVDRYKY